MTTNKLILEPREKEVLELCKQVLDVSPEWYDNPNGAYESTCPFCREKEYRGWENSFAAIDEISHNPNCAYLIAKGLTTNLL